MPLTKDISEPERAANEFSAVKANTFFVELGLRPSGPIGPLPLRARTLLVNRMLMKRVNIVCILLIAIGMFRFMRQMWMTVELHKASPAELIAAAKKIVPPEHQAPPTPRVSPLAPSGPRLPSASSFPSPVESPTPAGRALLGRGPFQGPTVKPKATPFLDKDGRPR